MPNERQTREPMLFPCEFCRTNWRRGLLHQHQLACPRNPTNRRTLHRHTNTQHRRPPSPPPPLPSRIPRPPRILRPPPQPSRIPRPPHLPPRILRPPPLPPRILRPPLIPPGPSHCQSENSVVSTTALMPDALQCPITSDIFQDPVLAEDGHTKSTFYDILNGSISMSDYSAKIRIDNEKQSTTLHSIEKCRTMVLQDSDIWIIDRLYTA
ncbi:unnamed protein product [Rotaria sordida]|uniref:Uncharacterized protein n=1 Tax=Rotaria sordida TaxID=392033 RepID=A0A819SK70_9BILA|nr:unnamed protein product [Rotaria sordida]